MNIYQVIFHIDRLPDGLSTIPNDLINLTCQSAATNDAPRNLITSLLHGILPTHVIFYVYAPGISYYIMLAMIIPPLHK